MYEERVAIYQIFGIIGTWRDLHGTVIIQGFGFLLHKYSMLGTSGDRRDHRDQILQVSSYMYVCAFLRVLSSCVYTGI